MSEAKDGGTIAERVVLSYRAPGVDPASDEWTLADSDWIRDRLAEETYHAYLRRVHAGEIAEGEELEEFVSQGCKSPQDVLLRVERVEGGTVLGEGTEIDVRPLAEFLKG